MTTKNVLDLFCGCGGFAKGFSNAGFNIVAGIDISQSAIDNYVKNFNHIGLCKDLSKYTPEEFAIENNISQNSINIITGGIPCQGFSIAGRRDESDKRNELFKYFIDYCDYFNPDVFIIENVIGILSMKNSENIKVIDLILSQLNINYNTVICKLYASDFEVPQNRRRVIIIGYRRDLGIIPTEPDTINAENRIGVGSILIPKTVIDTNEIYKKHYLSEKAISGIKKKQKKSQERGVGFGAQFLNEEKPSYTIPARYWKDGYDALVKYNETDIRRLTILELKRIQTFPDEYILEGSKKNIIMQIGNAIPVKFAYHIAKHICKELEM